MVSGWSKVPCIHCGKREGKHNRKNQCLDESKQGNARLLPTFYTPIPWYTRLYRGIMGALFGPESHSVNRYADGGKEATARK